MNIPRFAAAAALAALVAMPAFAQETTLSGTRLDLVATGEVDRVPDIARINAGVVTQGATASEAISQNAARMERVRAALKRAGIADRDIQTSQINLQPQYRYQENQPPQLIGYQAMNDVTVRFREIAKTGNILDALVREGANQINGPTLSIDEPDPALDEARTKAIAKARARADLYARTLGMRVKRIIGVSETGQVMPPIGRVAMMRSVANDSATQISPGEQTLSVTLTVSYELE